jgi:ABC-type uncharacterized transport system permease subunit
LIGQVIVSFISYVPNSYYSAKLINYHAREQFEDILPNVLVMLLASLLSYLSIMLLIELSELLKLVVVSILFPIFYLTTAYLFRLKSCSEIARIVWVKL